MTVETWPISRILPYEMNARKISRAAIDKVALSLREFGWQQPIVVDASGVIVVGHVRRLAAIQLGWVDAPVHVARELSPSQIKAYRLMDNRSHDEASWDHGLLGTELLDLKGIGSFDLALTGFDLPEVSRLIAPAESPVAGLTDQDACPEPPASPVTTLGACWQLGKHRILCGDCRDFRSMQALLGEAKANLVVTSPPYAEQREYDRSSGFRPIPPAEYVEWYRAVAVNLRRVLAADGSYFLNIKPGCNGLDTDLYVFDLVLAHVRQWGFHFATEFCWERNGVPKSVTQRFKNQFEPIYQFAVNRWKLRPEAVRHASENVPVPGGAGAGETNWANRQGGVGAQSVSGSFGAVKKRRNGTSERMGDVQGSNASQGEFIASGWAFPGNRLPNFAGTHEALGHGAAFPVGLPDFFIRAYTDAGDAVFDPFMGSGSTLIAAEKNARIAYGMEISPAYCDVIVKRWEAFTGRSATLESGGTFADVAARRGAGQQPGDKPAAEVAT